MNYSKEFEKLIKNCVKDNSHIGTGNPEANILFVGQEAAFEEKTEDYKSNAKQWQNKENQIYRFPVEDKNSYLRKTWGKNTWSKYQKLHDYIFEKKENPFYVDFLEKIFTTEMSDNPAKNNGIANKNPNFKSDLQKRKETFFNEDFIQNFSVVVLACSKYIQNNDKSREIDNIFNVSYVGDDFEVMNGLKGTKYYSRGNWYFLHLNHEKTKLVIHTRQLSSNVNNDLLKDLGLIINNHLLKNNLL